MKVTLFDAKPYDLPGFRRYGEQTGIEFKIYETKLNEDTVSLAAGSDAVCVFVNDTVNAPVIDRLAEYGV
ncbi:MAG: 2-hydroxyacid dehydrogenase, partial [Clostridia bacterium]|nr:2-hydroxyacid dehydrogenase [Clostridia bacterium]